MSRLETLRSIDEELKRIRIELYLLKEVDLNVRLKNFFYLLKLEIEVRRRLVELDGNGDVYSRQ